MLSVESTLNSFVCTTAKQFTTLASSVKKHNLVDPSFVTDTGLKMPRIWEKYLFGTASLSDLNNSFLSCGSKKRIAGCLILLREQGLRHIKVQFVAQNDQIVSESVASHDDFKYLLYSLLLQCLITECLLDKHSLLLCSLMTTLMKLKDLSHFDSEVEMNSEEEEEERKREAQLADEELDRKIFALANKMLEKPQETKDSKPFVPRLIQGAGAYGRTINNDRFSKDDQQARHLDSEYVEEKIQQIQARKIQQGISSPYSVLGSGPNVEAEERKQGQVFAESEPSEEEQDPRGTFDHGLESRHQRPDIGINQSLEFRQSVPSLRNYPVAMQKGLAQKETELRKKLPVALGFIDALPQSPDVQPHSTRSEYVGPSRYTPSEDYANTSYVAQPFPRLEKGRSRNPKNQATSSNVMFKTRQSGNGYLGHGSQSSWRSSQGSQNSLE